MTGPYNEYQIRLHRDALNTPWGLRLQGGKDFKAPLSVQRVFVGSPADGELHRGDVIVAIDNYDTSHLTHKQAQDVIKNAGGSLSLRIKRGGAGPSAASKPMYYSSSAPAPAAAPTFRSVAPFSPKAPMSPGGGQNMQNLGVDYSRGPAQHQYNRPSGGGGQDYMMNRVKNTLDNNLWTPDDSQDPEYEKKSIGQIKQMFSHDRPAPNMAVHASGRPSYQPRVQQWRKPETDGSALKEPGWAASPTKTFNSVPLPGAAQPEIINRPDVNNRSYQAPPRQNYQSEQSRHKDMGKPAWSGSLRSAGGPRPWEMHASDTIAPGSGEVNVPRGPSDVPRQAPQSQQYQPQQQQPQHDGDIHSQVHNPRVQNVHYAPGQSPQYQQQQPAQASDSASVVHNQYNSPLGLYSKENVQAVLTGQTAGKPGQGTLQVTGGDGKKQFNPAHSDVYRLLQEEEEKKKHRAEQQSARYEDHAPGQEMQYHGYMDHSHQSPRMNALEQYVMDEGTSDF